MTIYIVDTYSGNNVNFGQLKMDGAVGVIFKAGQGRLLDVPRVRPEWWQQAKDFGLLRGWYWLADSRIHSSDHFRAVDESGILDDMGELGFWVDVEKPVIAWTEAQYYATTYSGHTNVIDFVYLLTTAGVKPGIYSGKGAYQLVMRHAPEASHFYLAQFDLWTAQYNNAISEPDLYGLWTTWRFWQKSEGPDINIFNGTDEEFFTKYGNVPPPPQGEPAMFTGTVITTKLNIRPTAATTGDSIGSLLNGDKVEASEIISRWWKLSKITRGNTNLNLPAPDCYAYEGDNKGYIRLDSMTTEPPIIGEDIDVHVNKTDGVITVKVDGVEVYKSP